MSVMDSRNAKPPAAEASRPRMHSHYPDSNEIVTSDPDIPPNWDGADDGEIAARAYALWQERGCPDGDDQADWFKAEQEVQARRSRP